MARSQPETIKHQFRVGVVRSLDPEHVKGELLRTKIHELAPRLIWAEMGNTYALRHHLRESGGDEIIRELVTSGAAVFYGASAGAILAGRTIQMAFWKDWDDKTVSGQLSGAVVRAMRAEPKCRSFRCRCARLRRPMPPPPTATPACCLLLSLLMSRLMSQSASLIPCGAVGRSQDGGRARPCRGAFDLPPRQRAVWQPGVAAEAGGEVGAH